MAADLFPIPLAGSDGQCNTL